MRALAIVLGCFLLTSSAPALADDGTSDDRSEPRITAYVGTGVTAAFLALTTVSFFKYTIAIDHQKDKIANSQAEREAWKAAVEDAVAWRSRMIFSLGATIVAGGITGYLWTRVEQPRRRFTVTADERGATAWLSGNF